MGRRMQCSATMRSSLFVVALGLTTVLAACSSSSSGDPGTAPAAGGSSAAGGAAPSFDPNAHKNGVPIGETAACKKLYDATSSRASALSCTLSIPICPQYINAGAPEECGLYDQGVIDACVDFLNKLTCDQFVTHPCQLIEFTGTKGQGCAGAAGAAGASGSAGSAGATAGSGGAAAGAAGASAGNGGAAAGSAGASGAAGAAAAGAGGGAAAGAGGAAAGAGGAAAGAAGKAGAGGLRFSFRTTPNVKTPAIPRGTPASSFPGRKD